MAFKLAQALFATLEWPDGKARRMTESLMKMAAIATVADVVLLIGENRVIVKHGLESLGVVRNPGLRALLDVAGFPAGKIPSSRQVAFQIAPRLNAAGRMDTARSTVELFLTQDPERARALAMVLQEQNSDRRQVEAEIRDLCGQVVVDEASVALVYYSADWHRGVLGIVASRLVERFHRPVFVLGHNPEDGTAQGSGRSIPAFHLLDALESMRDLFVRFGGHSHAAGVTLDPGRVAGFRERFNTYAAGVLRPEDLSPSAEIDAILELREIDERAVTSLFSLAPFGHGNPPPLFASLNVEVAGAPVLWKEKHLKVMVRQNGRTLSLKAWDFAARAAELPAGRKSCACLTFAFRMEEDRYSGIGGRAARCSFGAWAIGGSWGSVDDDESMAALRAAVDAGVNFIDTADVYGMGRSERLIARLTQERAQGRDRGRYDQSWTALRRRHNGRRLQPG